MRQKLQSYYLFFCLCVASCFLIACSLTSPEYTKPQINISKQWANFSTQQITQINPTDNQAWWEKFHDQTLDELISSGLKNNNTVGKAQANVEQAEGQLKAVQYSWIPGFGLTGGYSNDPGMGSPLGFYGITAGYDVLNLFTLAARQKSAEITVAAQKEAVDAVKLNVVGQIAGSYYTYIAAAKQLEIYQHYQTDLNEMLKIQQENAAGKINSSIEVQSAEQEVDQAAAAEKILKSNIAKSQNALRYLLNQNSGKVATKTDFPQVKTDYPNFALLPASVLAKRPDVAIAELQYQLTTQNKSFAYTHLLPTVRLFDFQGYSDVSGRTLSGTSTNFGDAYARWAINPEVFGDIKALKGAEKANYYNYIDTVRAALRDVDNALIDHETANKTYQLRKQAYKAAQQKYVLVLRLYQAGISSYAEMLQEKINMDLALLELNQAKLMQILTVINVYQNLGI